LLPSTHTSAENPSLHCYPSWANVPGTHADGMPGWSWTILRHRLSR